MKKQILTLALAALVALPCATAATPDKSMAKVIEKGLTQSAQHALAMYDAVKDQGEKCFPCSLDKEGNLKLVTKRQCILSNKILMITVVFRTVTEIAINNVIDATLPITVVLKRFVVKIG